MQPVNITTLTRCTVRSLLYKVYEQLFSHLAMNQPRKTQQTHEPYTHINGPFLLFFPSRTVIRQETVTQTETWLPHRVCIKSRGKYRRIGRKLKTLSRSTSNSFCKRDFRFLYNRKENLKKKKTKRFLPAGFTGVQRPLLQQFQIVLVEIGHLEREKSYFVWPWQTGARTTTAA